MGSTREYQGKGDQRQTSSRLTLLPSKKKRETQIRTRPRSSFGAACFILLHRCWIRLHYFGRSRPPAAVAIFFTVNQASPDPASHLLLGRPVCLGQRPAGAPLLLYSGAGSFLPSEPPFLPSEPPFLRPGLCMAADAARLLLWFCLASPVRPAWP